MLSHIQIDRKESTDPEDAIGLLLGCHDRIRSFTEVALRLAKNPDAPATERVSAAQAVLRYYTVALPLHEADENESVYPRLRGVLLADPLAIANEAMLRQHVDIDAHIAELVPLWQLVEHAPEKQHTVADQLRFRTERLKRLWDVHLALEEQEVIPAMRRYLPDEELKAIEQEMRARRK